MNENIIYKEHFIRKLQNWLRIDSSKALTVLNYIEFGTEVDSALPILDNFKNVYLKNEDYLDFDTKINSYKSAFFVSERYFNLSTNVLCMFLQRLFPSSKWNSFPNEQWSTFKYVFSRVFPNINTLNNAEFWNSVQNFCEVVYTSDVSFFLNTIQEVNFDNFEYDIKFVDFVLVEDMLIEFLKYLTENTSGCIVCTQQWALFEEFMAMFIGVEKTLDKSLFMLKIETKSMVIGYKRFENKISNLGLYNKLQTNPNDTLVLNDMYYFKNLVCNQFDSSPYYKKTRNY